MARRNNTEELIHCNVCGEDYSPTYRRCPFCGERMDVRPAEEEEEYDDGYVFDGQALFDDDLSDQPVANKGGKRLANGGAPKKSAPPKKSSDRYEASPAVNWGRLITYGISLVMIIAALIIVFTVVYPMIHGNDTPDPNNSGNPPNTSDVDPGPGNTNQTPDPGVTDTTEPGPAPETPINSMTLSTYDFTLWYGQNHTIVATIDPADWDGELTWTSSNTEYAKVDSNGTVTNVNETNTLRRVTITVSGGGVTQECVVYCRGGNTNPDAGDVNTDEPVNTGTPGELTPGSTAYITGASSGLNVRSGPGTTYSVLASLVNGNEIKILEDAGNGWYKISFIGSNGAATAGYVKGDYVTATKP